MTFDNRRIYGALKLGGNYGRITIRNKSTNKDNTVVDGEVREEYIVPLGTKINIRVNAGLGEYIKEFRVHKEE